MKKRNIIITIEKFIFCVCIIIMHSHIPFGEDIFLTGAYVFVDFFFIIQGFYIYLKYCDEKESNLYAVYCGMTYIKNKIDLFLPITLLTTLLLGIVYFFINESSGNRIADLVNLVIRGIGEITFTTLFLPRFQYINPTLWFLSAYIFVGGAVVYMFKYFKDKLIIIASVAAIVIYSFLLNSYGSLGYADYCIGNFIPFGILRALAGMLLGLVCGYYSKKVLTKKNELLGKYIVIILLGLLMLSVIMAIYYGHSHYDGIFILIFAIVIILGDMYGKSTNNSMVLWMDEITMPMYVFQWLIIVIVNIGCDKSWSTLIYILMLDVICAFGWVCIEHLRKNKMNIM